MPTPALPREHTPRVQFLRNCPKSRMPSLPDLFDNRRQRLREVIRIGGNSFPERRTTLPCPS